MAMKMMAVSICAQAPLAAGSCGAVYVIEEMTHSTSGWTLVGTEVSCDAALTLAITRDREGAAFAIRVSEVADGVRAPAAVWSSYHNRRQVVAHAAITKNLESRLRLRRRRRVTCVSEFAVFLQTKWALARDELQLRRSSENSYAMAHLGRYYIVDRDDRLQAAHVDLLALAARVGALADNERCPTLAARCRAERKYAKAVAKIPSFLPRATCR